MELTLDQALQKGIEAHKAGKFQEADRYYTAILEANPKHPDANHNMGVLAVGIGKVEVSLPFFKAALNANPNIAQYWLSYIDAFLKLDRIADAKALLDHAKKNGAKGDGFDEIEYKIISHTPGKSNALDPTQEQIKSLFILYGQKKLQYVYRESQKLTRLYPKSLKLWNLMGASAAQIGQLDEAILAFQKAVSIKPDYVEAYINLGNAFQEKGNLEEAITSFEEALSIKPDYAEAYYNLGNALNHAGKRYEAIQAYNKALSIKPDYLEVYYNMGIVLTGIVFTTPSSNFQTTINSLLNKKSYIRPIDIARAAISLLKFEPCLQENLKLIHRDTIDSPLNVITDLNELALLLKLMSVCPLPDLELEALLINLRRFILSHVIDAKDASAELLNFQSALALQCFTNEYVYKNTPQEIRNLQTLETIVKSALKTNDQPSAQVVLALASYKALIQYEWYASLIVTEEIKEVFTRQVEEAEKENELKSCLPVLEEITDKVSSKVRDQYEKSPYPRWINLAAAQGQIPIAKIINNINLNIYDHNINEIERPEILIAGCGTGQHSIGTATRFKSSKILAIDLSLSSLAYAKRKTEELNIGNIEYMQADILDIGRLNKQFDIIESSGVLHHMENPMTGWKVLTTCLKPGGLMKIGLYSELARQHIVKIREEIKKLGIGLSDHEIKNLRDIIIRSDKDHHNLIIKSNDFYSLSTLRDLLFHVQEHRFNIPLIKDHLDELGLKFCGFESKKIVSQFRKTNTQREDLYDLDKWHAYEKANPNVFAEMYQFWCQKAE